MTRFINFTHSDNPNVNFTIDGKSLHIFKVNNLNLLENKYENLTNLKNSKKIMYVARL